jgi:Fe2+ transport system protein B
MFEFQVLLLLVIMYFLFILKIDIGEIINDYFTAVSGEI